MNIKKLKTYQDWCDWSSEIYSEAEHYGYEFNEEIPKTFPVIVVYEFDMINQGVNCIYIYKEDLK